MRIPQHEIFNRILHSQGGESISMLGKLDPSVFYSSDDKLIFNAISGCVIKGIEPNPSSVIKMMKDNKTFDKRFMSLFVELTNIDANNKLPFESLCTEAKDQTNERLVRMMSNQVILSIDNGTYTTDNYLTKAKEIETSLTSSIQVERTSKDIIERLIELHNKARSGEITGVRLGFLNLSKYITLESVDLMIVAARPAMGKSAFAVSCIKRLCFNQNLKVAFFSLEMSTEQIHRRLVAEVTGISMEKQKTGTCTESELNIIRAVANKIELDNITIFEGTHTNMDIRRKTTELKYTKGIDLIIVDYIQKIKPSRNSSSYEEITEVSGELKEICQNLKVPCIALAQLSRNSENRGGDKRPVLSDLKGSGSLEQDASIVAFLHRPEYYGFMEDENGNSMAGVGEFIIAKNREGECGLVNFKTELGLSRWTENDEVVISNSTLTANFDFDEAQEDETPF